MAAVEMVFLLEKRAKYKFPNKTSSLSYDQVLKLRIRVVGPDQVFVPPGFGSRREKL